MQYEEKIKNEIEKKVKPIGHNFITLILELKKALNREVDPVECAAGNPLIKKEILKQEISLL